MTTTAWDPADHLETPEDVVAYLAEAFAENEPALIAAALGDVARSRGMSEVARRAGVGRESLYRALSAEGNPNLTTLTRVLDALGMRLAIRPAA